MFGLYGTEITKHLKPFYVHRQKGFFSIMLLMSIQFLLGSLTLVYHNVSQIKIYQQTTIEKQKIELYLIYYIKHALAEYREEDEELEIYGNKITLKYDDITAYAKFTINQHLFCLKLVYDDLTNCVKELSYLEEGCAY